MSINLYTRSDFLEVSSRRSWNTIIQCDSLVILPLKQLHDSGYRLLDFVAIREGEPLCRVSGCSDVLHIAGIMGIGTIGTRGRASPAFVVPPAWCMDCLPKSGLLQIWPMNNAKIEIGMAMSSFEIFAIPKTGGKQNEIRRDRRRNNNHGNLHSTRRRNIRTD